jgi:hypothetical protein
MDDVVLEGEGAHARPLARVRGRVGAAHGREQDVVRPEHEVVDEELRAPSEEVCQRGAPIVGIESIRFVDVNPRQRLTPPRQLVAAPGELFLRLEQLEPSCEPFLSTSYLVLHRSVSFLK